MRNQMPSFLKKKKKNPKSRKPAKNTKTYSKGKSADQEKYDSKTAREWNRVGPKNDGYNKADAWIDHQSKPRRRFHGSGRTKYLESETGGTNRG